MLERWDSRLLRGSLPPEVAEQNQGKCFTFTRWSMEWATISGNQHQGWPAALEVTWIKSKMCVPVCTLVYDTRWGREWLKSHWLSPGRNEEMPEGYIPTGQHHLCPCPAPGMWPPQGLPAPTLSLKGLSQVWEERLPPGQGRVRRPWVELGTWGPQVCPADSVALLLLVTLGGGAPWWELCTEPSDDSGPQWTKMWREAHMQFHKITKQILQKSLGLWALSPHTTMCAHACRHTTTWFLGSRLWNTW